MPIRDHLSSQQERYRQPLFSHGESLKPAHATIFFEEDFPKRSEARSVLQSPVRGSGSRSRSIRAVSKISMKLSTLYCHHRRSNKGFMLQFFSPNPKTLPNWASISSIAILSQWLKLIKYSSWAKKTNSTFKQPMTRKLAMGGRWQFPSSKQVVLRQRRPGEPVWKGHAAECKTDANYNAFELHSLYAYFLPSDLKKL